MATVGVKGLTVSHNAPRSQYHTCSTKMSLV